MMSDHSPQHEDPAPSVQPLRLGSTSGEFVLIPQNIEPQTENDTDESINLGMLLAILRRQMPLALGILAATVGLGAALTLYQRIFSPVYEGGFSLLVGDPVSSVVQSQTSDSASDLKGLALQSSRVPNIQISQDLIDVLMSPLLLQPISKRMNISEEKLTENLTIERRSGDASSVLDISLKWKSPKEGEQILNTLKNDYLDFSTNQRREKLAEGIHYLNEQAPALQTKVSAIQAQLSDFRIRNRFLDPSTEGDAIVKQLEGLKERRDELLRKEAELNALAASVRAGNLNSPQIPGGVQRLSTERNPIGSIESRADVGFDQLQADLTQLEKDLAVAEASFQPTSPIVQSLKARIRRVKPLLQQRQLDAIEASLRQINGEMTEIQRQQTELQKKFSLNPALIKENDAIQQRLDVANANLTAYIKAREEFRLLMAQRMVPWKVISPPIFENRLSKPKVFQTMLVSILLGVGTGAGAAFLRDKMNNVFHTSQELEPVLGLPLLGSVAYLKRLSIQEETGRKAIDELLEDRPLREALRNLYTNIRLLRTDKKSRLLAMTSTMQGEGRSMLTSLYAQALSDLGKRVLVVDADLRHPVMHSFFGVPNGQGFSTLLSDLSCAPEQFIHALRGNLHLLTAGPIPSDPPSLLSSDRCAAVVEQIRRLLGYDYILFDLSPALELSDSLLISQHLDGILFVVSLGLVRRDLPAQALKRIQRTGTAVLGAVSNDMGSKKRPTQSVMKYLGDRVSAIDRWRDNARWRGMSTENT